ncbi:hypothetical protein KQI84_14635 [bacterium]|nr:hypothetical protein [bacterium]
MRIGFAADSVRGTEVDPSVVPGVSMFERDRLREYLEEQKPDAIVLQHWGLGASLPPVDCPLAVDLAGPHLLERRLWGSKRLDADLREKVETLSRADFVICSGRFQRHYFLPFLFQAGFEPEASLCPVVPFSVAPDIPAPSENRDLSAFLYGGFFLPWQDPENSLRWTLETLDEREKGKLVVVGGPHPSIDVSGGRFEKLGRLIDEHPRAESHGTMPFGEYLSLLGRCGAAIDLMPRNSERELAFPTRTVVALWAGLPVIHNNYDELAEPIERAKAGWTLDPGDRQGFRKVIDRLVGHGEDIERRGQNAQELVRKHFTWDKTIHPLADWCREPRKREGKTTVAMPAATKAPRDAASKKGRVSYSPPPPVAGPNRLQQVLSPLALLLALPIALVLLILFGGAELVKILMRRR